MRHWRKDLRAIRSHGQPERRVVASWYAPRIAPLTTRDVYEAARRHLRPGEVKIIAMGDQAQIEPQLAELNLGTIGYRAADGGPGE